ncbi:MAG: preprotein translocase subunit YajC [Gammaproteobacteria bacterium]|jgi:preprotein translocase subunit YajC
MDILSSTVYAAEAGQQASPMSSIIMLIIFGLIFYFMLIRPQSKRAKEHKSMVEALQKGDEVISSGGLAGKITEVDETFIKLKVAENVEVSIQRNAVASVLPKGSLKAK